MNQTQLKEMFNKGYRFQISPRSQAFEPLCVKTANDFAKLARTTYPNEVFDIATIDNQGKLTPFKTPYWIVVGERKLVIFCSNSQNDAKRFAKNIVAKVAVVLVNREYNRGDKYQG